jgi:hypothetical protein
LASTVLTSLKKASQTVDLKAYLLHSVKMAKARAEFDIALGARMERPMEERSLVE